MGGRDGRGGGVVGWEQRREGVACVGRSTFDGNHSASCQAQQPLLLGKEGTGPRPPLSGPLFPPLPHVGGEVGLTARGQLVVAINLRRGGTSYLQ